MRRDALFRGCTRPAMIMGVPYVPFAFGAGACFLLAVYLNFFCLLLLPIVIFVMRQMARRDEMIFRLLGLRWQLMMKTRNRSAHSGMWMHSPNPYRDRSATR